MNPFIKFAASTAAIIGVFTSSALAQYSVGTVTGNNVNLRSGAGTDQPIVATVPLNTQITVMGNNAANGDGSWLQAQYDGQVVWVSGMYVSLSPETATLSGVVTGTSVNVRSGAGTDQAILGQQTRGDTVTIQTQFGPWYQIIYNNGIGYIHSDYVSLSYNGMPSRGNANALIGFAERFLGTPYVYGGSTPNGFDCSGYTQYVFRQMGYELNRTAASQATQGTPVAYGEWQPGDLLFFRYYGGAGINHVGIYIGNGVFIHSSSSSGVRYNNVLSDSYYISNYVTARRYF